MGNVDERYKEILAEETNSERLQFFSDAVFAIAMTLLVIDITVPNLTNPSNRQLGDAVVALFPQFLAYAISFAFIAVNWVGHHRKFSVTRRYDGTVVWINMLLLFLIAFLPFPTSLLSNYGGKIVAVVLYASVVAAIGLVQCWLWSYTYRKGYLDRRIDRYIYRHILRNILVAPVVFIFSIPVAFLPDTPLFTGGIWAMFFWILNSPVSFVVGRIGRGTAGSRPGVRVAAAMRSAARARSER